MGIKQSIPLGGLSTVDRAARYYNRKKSRRIMDGPSSVVRRGLVSYYKLNGDVKDSVGGFDGLRVGGAFVDSERGTVLSLDGVNDYTDGLNSMSGYAEASLSIWYNIDPSETLVTTVFSSATFTIQHNTALNKQGVLWINHDGTGNYQLFEIPQTTGTWQHLVLTDDGTTLKVYVNGSLFVYTLSTSSSVSNVRDTGAIGASVGDFGDVAHCKCLAGPTRMYDRILTFNEVLTIYNAENPGTIWDDNESWNDSEPWVD